MGRKENEFIAKPKSQEDSAKYHSRSASFKAEQENNKQNKATPATK